MSRGEPAKNSFLLDENGSSPAAIGTRLKLARGFEPKRTQSEAAKISGASLRAWSDYEAGQRMAPVEVLSKFADERGIDFFVLVTGRVYTQHDSPLEIDIPVYAKIHAGSLTRWIPDEPVIDYIRASIKDLDVYALKVEGESMFPDIQDSDIVICSPHRTFISGKIYAAVIGDDEATVKRVWKRTGGIDLVPTNPEFESRFVPEDKIIRLDRVVEVRRPID